MFIESKPQEILKSGKYLERLQQYRNEYRAAQEIDNKQVVEIYNP